MASRVSRKLWAVPPADDLVVQTRDLLTRMSRYRKLRDVTPRWRWRVRRSMQREIDAALEELCHVVGGSL